MEPRCCKVLQVTSHKFELPWNLPRRHKTPPPTRCTHLCKPCPMRTIPNVHHPQCTQPPVYTNPNVHHRLCTPPCFTPPPMYTTPSVHPRQCVPLLGTQVSQTASHGRRTAHTCTPSLLHGQGYGMTTLWGKTIASCAAMTTVPPQRSHLNGATRLSSAKQWMRSQPLPFSLAALRVCWLRDGVRTA